MKILFVENRYATWIWCSIAAKLESDGHEIFWLVQNPMFEPNIGQTHVVPFPKQRKSPVRLDGESFPDFEKLRTDRAIRYFGKSDHHHAHYKASISKILAAIEPDMIFGETTQFHELITIAIARQRGIFYAAPSATRYPPERVTFQIYDQLDPFGGSGKSLANEAAEEMLDAINTRRLVPSYMRASSRSAARRKLSLLGDKIRVVTGWLAGERFVTPSPIKKISLEKRQRRLRDQWERCAVAEVPRDLDSRPWVLYAIQMQPESNIDVWGFPWNDQTAIIREAADALGAIGGKLVVKPNPKSKYELEQALCQLVAEHPHIVALAHGSKMSDVFPRATAVMSVTGTVILEAILAGKPVGVIGDHAMARYEGATALSRPSEIAQMVLDLPSTGQPARPTTAGIRLLNMIHSASYPGILFDPLNQPEFNTAENMAQLVFAFRDIIKRHAEIQ